MREKYIDEKYRRYFEFGKHQDGRVYVSNGQDDVCAVTKNEAITLIVDRDELLQLVYLINEKYPKEFEECFNAL